MRYKLLKTQLLLLLLFCFGTIAQAQNIYEKDVLFALKELEKECKIFFKLKKINWKRVSKEFIKEAKSVKNDSEHLVLLTRLLARLKDGHAAVIPLDKEKKISWPSDSKGEKTGPGMFWCQIGKKIYVKNSWSSAKEAGVLSGMEIVKVNTISVHKWLAQRVQEHSDLWSFSTEHQAFFSTTHWGLADYKGTRLKLQVKNHKGKPKKRTITYSKASVVPMGPAFFPKDMKSVSKDISYTKTEKGWGYIHLRRCPKDMPEQMDKALVELQDVPGIILDFRANGGGGFDHEGFMGRFIPKGKTISFNKRYKSAGPNPYGGPLIIIIDAGTRSAGETASGIFKEDGRGYLIGESPTAGMSASKKTIKLPSGLFGLYVAVYSNLKRANDSKGIEGIGIIPHETILYHPKDLEKGTDTLIKKAEMLLAKYPQKKVPYNPKKFGWKTSSSPKRK